MKGESQKPSTEEPKAKKKPPLEGDELEEFADEMADALLAGLNNAKPGDGD